MYLLNFNFCVCSSFTHMLGNHCNETKIFEKKMTDLYVHIGNV